MIIKKKIFLVFSIMSLLFLTIVIKAFYVQIISRDKLISYSKSQSQRVKKILPKRGNILDRNGHPLAISAQSFSLAVHPENIKNKNNFINKIIKIIPTINKTKLHNKLRRRKKFTWIARNIALNKNQIKKLEAIKKLQVTNKLTRFYPNNELLSQTLGFVGVDNNGLAGIEYQFNNKLKGKIKTKSFHRDAKGRIVKYVNIDEESTSVDIILSIDKNIQAALESFLKKGVLKHDADRGGAAVMDTDTGEIWAMANYPSFDPNKYKRSKEIDRKLSFVTDPFEPGSILKTFTIASALENKIVDPKTSYYCERGKLKVDNHIIREAENLKKFEWLSVIDILKYSSNIGTTKIAFDLKYPLLKKTFKLFNFGKKTNIEYPGESKGIFTSKTNIKPLRLSNISFGQGIATTGVQILAAYAAIANNGIYVNPTILKTNNNHHGKQKRIISKKTAMQIKSMLVKAVEDGTGKNAIVPHFTIAGKTSTAQRIEGGEYKGYIAGFIGFPMNITKKFVVLVYVENPKKAGYYGSLDLHIYRYWQ